MLFYIDEVPEKQHHPKETELLFPILVKRSPQCAEVIQRLNNEHHKGESSIRDLQHMLLGW
jgi:hemerythrin-like domain-containing protein